MKRVLFVTIASLLLFTITGFTQEVRNEVSVQGTGFFTKDSKGNGVSRTTTNTGGLEVGYRYHIDRWLSAEANYGFDRNMLSLGGLPAAGLGHHLGSQLASR